jgi:hypothetical protein
MVLCCGVRLAYMEESVHCPVSTSCHISMSILKASVKFVVLSVWAVVVSGEQWKPHHSPKKRTPPPPASEAPNSE